MQAMYHLFACVHVTMLNCNRDVPDVGTFKSANCKLISTNSSVYAPEKHADCVN